MVKDAAELQAIRRAVELGREFVSRSRARRSARELPKLRSPPRWNIEARSFRGRRNVVSDDPRFRTAFGGRAWTCIDSAYSAARVRGLRFWCYTRRLLLRSHAYCARGQAVAGSPAVVRGGAGSTGGSDRCRSTGGDRSRSGCGSAVVCFGSASWRGTSRIPPGMV